MLDAEITEATNVADRAQAMDAEDCSQDAISLEHAMRIELKSRNRILKATHHIDFLQKCVKAKKIPKGLRIHHQEIHLMDSPTVINTRATLSEMYKRTKLDICKALIEHYVQIRNDSKEALEQVVRTIQKKLKQKGLEACS